MCVNRVRFVPDAGVPSRIRLGVEVEPMRAKDAVGTHGQEAACVRVHQEDPTDLPMGRTGAVI